MTSNYYFISYIWRHRKQYAEWALDNCFINQEPWEWMTELQDQFNDEIQIVSTMKVSKDVYDKWEERFS